MNIYTVYTTNTALGLCAFAEKIHNSNNIVSFINSRNAECFQVFETWKKALQIAEQWNKDFINNGLQKSEYMPQTITHYSYLSDNPINVVNPLLIRDNSYIDIMNTITGYIERDLYVLNVNEPNEDGGILLTVIRTGGFAEELYIFNTWAILKYESDNLTITA